MYVVAVPILIFLVCGVTANRAWEYSLNAKTLDGQPCLTNCNNNRCVTSWNGSTKECGTNKQPVARFRTAQVLDKKNKYCLSNCGYFGYHYQWCVTTEQKSWDYCNAEQRFVTVFNKPCRGECQKGSFDYYWCHVEDGGDWQYCAPSREQDDDFDIDPRYTQE